MNVMSAVSRLARAYHPEAMVAPNGRGPEGWPLIPCLHCGRPIPWTCWGRTLGPISPGRYYRLKFCQPNCKTQWSRTHAGQPARRADQFEIPLKVGDALAAGATRLETETTWLNRFPPTDAILECRKCHSAALQAIRVGRQCQMCGTIMYARDGDWAGELLRLA